MIVTLVNDDFRYDPTNTSSILYPYVAPGVFCRLGVRRPQDDTYNWRFTGYITDVKCYQDPQTRANYCDLTIADGWSWFQNQNIYVPTIQNYTIDQIVNIILTACGWPFGYVSDGGVAAFPYYWCGGDTVYNNLGDLGDAQGDRIYLTNDGVLHTEARTATESLAGSFLQSDVLVNIPRIFSWANLWNVVSIGFINLKTWGFGGTLPCSAWGDRLTINLAGTGKQTYLYADPTSTQIIIPANSSVILTGNYNDGITDAFVINYDTLIGKTFTVFARTFLSSIMNTVGQIYPLIFSFYTTSIPSFSTQVTGEVTITSFLNGGSGFYAVLKNTLNVPVYSGGILIASNQPVYNATASSSTYTIDSSNGQSQKEFTLNSPYFQGTLASSYGTYVAKYYSQLVSLPYVLPTVTLEGRPDVQYLQMGSRINVNLALYNLASDYRIGAMDEKWLTPNGQSVQTTITTEPYVVATG